MRIKLVTLLAYLPHPGPPLVELSRFLREVMRRGKTTGGHDAVFWRRLPHETRPKLQDDAFVDLGKEGIDDHTDRSRASWPTRPVDSEHKKPLDSMIMATCLGFSSQSRSRSPRNSFLSSTTFHRTNHLFSSIRNHGWSR